LGLGLYSFFGSSLEYNEGKNLFYYFIISHFPSIYKLVFLPFLKLAIFVWSVLIGQNVHQQRSLVQTPRTIDISVVKIHIWTKINPIAYQLFSAFINLKIKKPINKNRAKILNLLVVNNRGIFRFRLNRLTKISKNDPRGHKKTHHNLPLK